MAHTSTPTKVIIPEAALAEIAEEMRLHATHGLRAERALMRAVGIGCKSVIGVADIETPEGTVIGCALEVPEGADEAIANAMGIPKKTFAGYRGITQVFGFAECWTKEATIGSMRVLKSLVSGPANPTTAKLRLKVSGGLTEGGADEIRKAHGGSAKPKKSPAKKSAKKSAKPTAKDVATSVDGIAGDMDFLKAVMAACKSETRVRILEACRGVKA